MDNVKVSESGKVKLYKNKSKPSDNVVVINTINKHNYIYRDIRSSIVSRELWNNSSITITGTDNAGHPLKKKTIKGSQIKSK